MLDTLFGTSTQQRSHRSSANRLARGLGWFSLGVGLMEIAAPGRLARFLGMRKSETMFRTYGLREVATGAAILASRNPTPFIWGRVAGDALDITTLANGAMTSRKKWGIGFALAAVGLVTAVDLICAQTLTNHHKRSTKALPDYSNRTGFSRPVQAMRGAAKDFKAPRDMKAAAPLSAIS